MLKDVIVKEIKFDYREAESDVAARIKDWTNDGYQVDVFYDGSATTSVLLVAKKSELTDARKRSKLSEEQKKQDT